MPTPQFRDQSPLEDTLPALTQTPQKDAGDVQKGRARNAKGNKTVNFGRRSGAERLAFDINAKIDSMDAQLQDLGALAEVAQQLQASLSEIKHLEDNLNTQIEEVTAQMSLSSRKQAKLKDELQQAFHSANRDLDQRISKLYASLGTHNEQLGTLESALPALRVQISRLSEKLAGDQQHTKKRFRWLTAGIAIFALATVGAIGYIQFNPSVVPTAVQTQLTQTKQSIQQNVDSIAALFAGLGTLETRLSTADSELKGLHATDADTYASIAQLDGKLDTSLRQIDNSLKAAADEIDDLKFRIEGPTNRGADLVEAAIPIQGREWLASQNPEHYSIQLAGFYRYQYLVGYVNNNDYQLNDRPIAFNQGKLGLRDWYNLFYGSYPTMAAAEAALDALPLRLRGNNPFVRSFASIQR